MVGGWKLQEPSELAPVNTTSSGNGTVAFAPSTQLIAEGSHHVKSGAIDVVFLGHRPSINGTRLSLGPWADVVLVRYQATSDASAALMDSQLARLPFYGVVADCYDRQCLGNCQSP